MKLLKLSVYFLFFALLISSLSAFSNELDSLNKALTNADNKQKAEIYFKIYQFYYDKDSMHLALLNAQKALKYAQFTENTHLLAKINSRIGYIYLYWDDLINAQKYFLQTIKISKESSDSDPLLFAYRGLGRTNTLISNYEKAIFYYNNGLKLSQEVKNEKETAIFNNEIGNMYLQMKNFEKAKHHYLEFYGGGIKLNDSMIIIYALNNLGITNRKLGKYDEAIKQFEQSLDFMVAHNLMMGQASTLGGIGEVYLAKEAYSKALVYFQKSNAIAESQGFKYWTADNEKQISLIFKKLGLIDSAFNHYIVYSDLRDTLLNLEKEKQIRGLESKHDIDQNEKKIIILEKESKNKEMLLYVTFSTTALALIIIFLIYHSNRLKKKLYVKEKQEMDDVISQKNREMVSVLMESVHKKQLIEDFEKEIEAILKTDNLSEKTKEIASNIKGKLHFNVSNDDEWITLRKHFEEVHPEFFSKLINLHPSLTPLELRHCAYIKINLTSKDVARILNISVRSVQTSRYRLKKKLKLEEEINVMHYIHSI